jgi:hypothetical protein
MMEELSSSDTSVLKKKGVTSQKTPFIVCDLFIDGTFQSVYR